MSILRFLQTGETQNIWGWRRYFAELCLMAHLLRMTIVCYLVVSQTSHPTDHWLVIMLDYFIVSTVLTLMTTQLVLQVLVKSNCGVTYPFNPIVIWFFLMISLSDFQLVVTQIKKLIISSKPLHVNCILPYSKFESQTGKNGLMV